MKIPSIVSERSKIDYLFTKSELLYTDSELLSHWARYLCVVIYGFVENAMREIFYSYALKQSSPEIANFVRNRIRGVRNWNIDKIFETTGLFDPTMRDTLESRVDQELIESLTSIVNNRLSISHGTSVTVSYIQVKGYYSKVTKLLDIIQGVVNV